MGNKLSPTIAQTHMCMKRTELLMLEVNSELNAKSMFFIRFNLFFITKNISNFAISWNILLQSLSLRMNNTNASRFFGKITSSSREIFSKDSQNWIRSGGNSQVARTFLTRSKDMEVLMGSRVSESPVCRTPAMKLIKSILLAIRISSTCTSSFSSVPRNSLTLLCKDSMK